MVGPEPESSPSQCEIDTLRAQVARLKAEQLQTVELLQQERRNTSVVLDAIGTLTLELDLEGRIVRANRACQEATGYRSSELQGQRLCEVLAAAEEAAEVQRGCDPTSAESFPRRHENHWITKSGRKRLICWSSSLLSDAAGEPQQVVVTGTDVTEQQQVAEAVRLQDQRLNSLLQLTQKAVELDEREIISLTLEEAVRLTQSKLGYLHFVDHDRQAIEAFAWSYDTLRQCAATQQEHYPLSSAGIWADAIRTNRPAVHNDYPHEPGRKGLPAGHVPIQRHVSIPVAEGDRPAMVLGVGNKEAEYNASDVRQLILTAENLWKIVRRKRSERMLRESEERYRTLVESSPDAIALTTPDGHLLTANRQFFHLSGYADLREIQQAGLTAFDLFDPSEVARARAEAQRIFEEGTTSDVEYVVRRKDGSVFHAELTTAAVLDAQGKPTALMAMIRDITHRRRLEKVLHEHVRRLEEEDRNKDDFLAMLAHELRNPLAPISSGVDLLSMPELPDDVARETRQIMRQQLGHLVRLVDDLLDVSRITRKKIALKCGEIDLQEVVEHAVEISRSLIDSRSHRLHLRRCQEAVPISGDPVRLAQVVANLLNNAAKYTRENGQIWLSVAREHGQAVIRVRDNGLGIAPQSLPRVFEPFVQGHATLDRSDGGLGLGLTLVRHLVELHGGNVEALSAGADQGSEFIVRLPLSAEPAAHPVAPPEPVIERTSAGARVLIVDDNLDAATLLGLLLQGSGYEVQTAADGPSGLEKVEAWSPQIVLLDIGLPGMDGYEVAQRLRQSAGGADLLIVAVSGYGHSDARQRSRAAGFDHHLVKPVNPKRLMSLLAEHAASVAGAGQGT